MVTAQVNSGVGGAALIPIWPQIRESQADQAPVNVTKAQGLFALTANERKVTLSESRLFGVSFSAVEAL